MRFSAPVRLVARARSSCRRLASGRTARRAARIVGRALVYGLAPSVASDALLDHRAFDASLVAHDAALNTFAALAATAVGDLFLLARVM